jgi:(p)ppGpp synthase/HD superfamily hydrolase
MKVIGAKAEKDRARSFAEWAHGTQRYGDHHPYVKHLDDVVAVAEMLHADHDVRIAAYLHDVVEDTDVSIAAIEELFGQNVAKLVAAVTNEHGETRAERHARTYPKTRAAGANAVLLKLCDRIANVTASIGPTGGTLLQMYAKEREAFHKALALPGENSAAWLMLHETYKLGGLVP